MELKRKIHGAYFLPSQADIYKQQSNLGMPGACCKSTCILTPVECEHSINIDKGNYNRKYNRKSGFIQLCTFKPLPVLLSLIKLSHPQPNLLQQKSASMREPRGKILLETIKSSKSMNGSNSSTQFGEIKLKIFKIRKSANKGKDE